MELKQLIEHIQQNPGLRALLPLQQGLLYPYFVVSGGRLCAHFLTSASTIGPEGMRIYPPACHVTVLCGEGRVVGVRSLRWAPEFGDVDFSEAAVIPKKDAAQRAQAKQDLQELERLANHVLKHWEAPETAELEAYHKQLARLLTDQQMQMYLRVAGCA